MAPRSLPRPFFAGLAVTACLVGGTVLSGQVLSGALSGTGAQHPGAAAGHAALRLPSVALPLERAARRGTAGVDRPGGVAVTVATRALGPTPAGGATTPDPGPARRTVAQAGNGTLTRSPAGRPGSSPSGTAPSTPAAPAPAASSSASTPPPATAPGGSTFKRIRLRVAKSTLPTSAGGGTGTVALRLAVSGQAAAGAADVPSVLDLGLAVNGGTAKATLAQADGQPVALATTIDLDHATSATAAADLRLRMRVLQGADVPSSPVVREVDGDASGLSTAVEVVVPLTAPATGDDDSGTADRGGEDDDVSQGHDSGSDDDEGACDGDGDADDVGCPPADPAPDPAPPTPDATPAPDVEVRLPVAATPDAGEPATPTSGATASVPATGLGTDPSSPDPTPAPDLNLQVGVVVTPSSPTEPVTEPPAPADPATTDPATTDPATSDPVTPADPEPTTTAGPDEPAGGDGS